MFFQVRQRNRTPSLGPRSGRKAPRTPIEHPHLSRRKKEIFWPLFDFQRLNFSSLLNKFWSKPVNFCSPEIEKNLIRSRSPVAPTTVSAPPQPVEEKNHKQNFRLKIVFSNSSRISFRDRPISIQRHRFTFFFAPKFNFFFDLYPNCVLGISIRRVFRQNSARKAMTNVSLHESIEISQSDLGADQDSDGLWFINSASKHFKIIDQLGTGSFGAVEKKLEKKKYVSKFWRYHDKIRAKITILQLLFSQNFDFQCFRFMKFKCYQSPPWTWSPRKFQVQMPPLSLSRLSKKTFHRNCFWLKLHFNCFNNQFGNFPKFCYEITHFQQNSS